MYRRYVKRIIDVILSLVGLILASWLYMLIMIAIEIDDPGPVFFSQKRVGIHKKYFQLYKFRSMKMSTPHDMPTHLLENPEQYITRVGKFLRKTSLDEIPQLWNILRGDMSVIGPRPALWNQEDLLAERDKYGANDVKPGLSGWAQICGRDELEISDKARLDGEYVQRMSFSFDCRCFFGTAISAWTQSLSQTILQETAFWTGRVILFRNCIVMLCAISRLTIIFTSFSQHSSAVLRLLSFVRNTLSALRFHCLFFSLSVHMSCILRH